MQWLNNLSIKYKLLLGFILVAFLIIPGGIFCVYNIYQIGQSFSEIVNSTFPRQQALSEIKNVAIKIQLVTIACKNVNSQKSNVECKNDLLANIEKIGLLAKQYENNIPETISGSLDVKKLNSLQDQIILLALKVIQQKDEGKIEQLKATEQELILAENYLSKYIQSSLNKENLKIEQSRVIAKQKIDNIIRVTLISIFLGFVIAVIISFVLTSFISKPIIRLNDFSKALSADNINTHFVLATRDEIGQLAESVNKMLDKLQFSHQQLMIAARKAGMAEIATSVLHNIGNVLNSLNVSASLLLETISKTQINNLTKVTFLLEENFNNLTEFLTYNERGKNIPDYLIKLTKHIELEQETMQQELQTLIKHVQHIKNIISSQQSLSGKNSFFSSELLTEIINEAILLTKFSVSKEDIKIEKIFLEDPKIITDKIKLQQVLINLLKNAKDALIASDNNNKVIVIRVEKLSKEFIKVSFNDNGIGMDKGTLEKLFTFGFTTKPAGHGFGLHSAFIAVKELGGSITVDSLGIGKGTTFVLKLPYKIKN